MQDQKILNALRMQPLSEEEKTSRHILGRLYGPIATCVESTRNGRLYNRTLWEKALVDEIFLEKVATKALFLELGHPADREETDMKQACACIPEVPKIVGDELYAYVDILDTPNGRLLKTLVDYGFVPGISSRGSGDVMDNNQVDPETFFLETWDIVQLPAVKKARLNVCESLDSDSIKLRKALAESYETAKEEDKDTMKQALENLNIDISESLDNMVDDVADADIPWDPDDETADTLVEDAEEEVEEVEEVTATEEETEDTEETTGTDDEEVIVSEEEEPADASEEEPAEAEEVIVDVTAEGEVDVDTVSDVVELLQDYDDTTKVEFEAVQIDGQEYPVDGITAEVTEDGDEKVLVIGVNCDDAATEETEAEEVVTDDDTTETEEEPTDEAPVEEIVADEPAEDTGDDEVIESLKEMIRKKEALENELSDLRKAKSVGDAKEKELQEKLGSYRTAFKKASAEAALVPELQAKVTELSESLDHSRETIETLTEEVNNARQLKESVEVTTEAKIRKLSEQVEKLSRQNKTLEAQLEDTTKQYTKKLQERTDTAKMYKKRCVETLTRYIDSKASMLGVASSEITSRLNESYTLSDVDAVCDKILNSTVNLGRLPFGGRTKASARISESVSRNTTASSFTDPSNGYDIDDSLLELAGLK